MFASYPRSLFRRAQLPLALAAAILMAAGTEAGAWKGTEVDKEGVKHVMNPAKGMEKPVAVELDERWRIGGEDDEEIFGVVTDIITDDDGNFYLLDAQLSEIKVYSPDGEHQRTIGREGEGPGEFRRAFSMFRVPGGNIGVLNVFPSQIVVLTPEGEPGDEFEVPAAEGFRVFFGGRYAGDQLALAYGLNKPSETGFSQENVLVLIRDGKEIRLHSQTATMSNATSLIAEKEWDSFRNRWTTSPDGHVYSQTELGTYAIHQWSPDGKLARVIERDYGEHERSAEDKAELLEIYKGFMRRMPIPNIKYEIEDTFNPVHQVYARADGTLWVATSRGARDLDDGVAGVFDVYDAEGRFYQQVTLKGEGDPTTDGYFFVKDRLFVVTDFLAAMMALQGGGGEGEESDDEVEAMQVISYGLDKIGPMGMVATAK